MILFIPKIGECIKLTEPWTASVSNHYSNRSFIGNVLNLKKGLIKNDTHHTDESGRTLYDQVKDTGWVSAVIEHVRKQDHNIAEIMAGKLTNEYVPDTNLIIPLILPAGIILKFEKYDITRQNTGFVHFRALQQKRSKIHGKFWVTLANANEMNHRP